MLLEFLNPKGFKTENYNLDSFSHDVVLFGKQHYINKINNYEVNYRFSREYMNKLVEVLKKEKYYKNDLYWALAGRFGKKIDENIFQAYLNDNNIRYHRNFRIESKDDALEPIEIMDFDPENEQI